MKLIGRIAAILGLALVLLTGCDGSGDDNGPVTPPPQSNQAAGAADNAIDAMEISAEGGGESLKGSFAATKAFEVGKAFRRNQPRGLTSIMAKRFNIKNFHSKAAVLQQMVDCPAGGSQEIINNISTDTELRFTVQYDQCRDRAVDDNGTELERLRNGLEDLQLLIMISGSSGSIEVNETFENLTTQISIVSSGIVLVDALDNIERRNTVAINDFTNCGDDITGQFSLTSNGTIQISSDGNADGDVNDSDDTDTSAIVTNYAANGTTIVATEEGTDPNAPNCNITAFLEIDVATSGSVSFTDNINPRASFAISSPMGDPLRINERVEQGGRSYTIDGTLTVSVDRINDPCIEQDRLTFRFTTPPMERIFIPDFQPCPTAGQLMVELNGDEITVNYTASGGVEVISGDMVETFDSCDDIDACRSSI